MKPESPFSYNQARKSSTRLQFIKVFAVKVACILFACEVCDPIVGTSNTINNESLVIGLNKESPRWSTIAKSAISNFKIRVEMSKLVGGQK